MENLQKQIKNQFYENQTKNNENIPESKQSLIFSAQIKSSLQVSNWNQQTQELNNPIQEIIRIKIQIIPRSSQKIQWTHQAILSNHQWRAS